MEFPGWLLLLLLAFLAVIPIIISASSGADPSSGLNIFLFISFSFLFTYLAGRFMERFRIPWIFAALLLGSLLAISNPFGAITSSDTFTFLAQLGMYFLLFIVGFEINVGDLRKKSGFIFKATFFIIAFEGVLGSIFVHYVFGYDWIISILVSMSFATVGEAILIPILDEFRIINTPLGQTIIGIGTLDDIVEILTLIGAVVLIGARSSSEVSVAGVLASLAVLFAMAYALTRLKKQGRKFGYSGIETLFLLTIFVLFLFLGVGDYADTTPLAALLAGIALGNFLPRTRRERIQSELKAVCYGLFAPLFFIWVGASMDFGYLAAAPLLVIAITVVSKAGKLISSYIVGRKELGTRGSILLGIALSVRFSTSIIVLKILYENGLIRSDVYSVLLASTIVFKFIVPLLLSNLLVRWGFAKPLGRAN
ncbi:MAG TPA: cation:proton antiporter [Candidatus Bilamarchaeum sp.]|nr:cation:proton antiporter [Candidatus Bilamarchaeum sp.]